MNLATVVRSTGLFCLLFHASASAIPEEEPNDKRCGYMEEDCYPIQSPQLVSLADGEVSISGVIGELGLGTRPVSDVDFFSFDAEAGESYTFAIQDGAGGQERLEAYIAVFSPGPDYSRVRWAKYGDAQDPVIAEFTPLRTGLHTVGVTVIGREFLDTGGLIYRNPPKNGDYTLVMTHNLPEVLPVSIDIRPGNGKAAWPKDGNGGSKRFWVNPKSKGIAAVAIHSTIDFNATEVDPASLTFGASGDELSVKRCSVRDVSGNGRDDLVCEVDMSKAAFPADATEGQLKGRLKKAGTPVKGKSMLVPERPAE